MSSSTRAAGGLRVRRSGWASTTGVGALVPAAHGLAGRVADVAGLDELDLDLEDLALGPVRRGFGERGRGPGRRGIGQPAPGFGLERCCGASGGGGPPGETAPGGPTALGRRHGAATGAAAAPGRAPTLAIALVAAVVAILAAIVAPTGSATRPAGLGRPGRRTGSRDEEPRIGRVRRTGTSCPPRDGAPDEPLRALGWPLGWPLAPPLGCPFA